MCVKTLFLLSTNILFALLMLAVVAMFHSYMGQSDWDDFKIEKCFCSLLCIALRKILSFTIFLEGFSSCNGGLALM